MNCKDFLELISLYIDSEIDDIQKKEFEKHLNDCKKCRTEYENVLSVVSMLKDLPDEELPENFCSDLHDKLLKETENQGSRKILFFRSNAFKAVSTVAAGILVVFLVKHLFFYDTQIMTKNDGNTRQSKLMEAAENDTTANGFKMGQEPAVEKMQMDDVRAVNGEKEVGNESAEESMFFEAPSHGYEKFSLHAVEKSAREVHIIVKADPASEFENIQNAALQNNAVRIISDRSELKIEFTENCLVDETDKVVGFILDNSDYANFNSYLKQTYGSSGIEYRLDEIQNYREAFDSANEYLNKITKAIDKEKNSEVSDPDTIKSLEDSQQEYLKLIEVYKDKINKTKVLLTIKD